MSLFKLLIHSYLLSLMLAIGNKTSSHFSSKKNQSSPLNCSSKKKRQSVVLKEVEDDYSCSVEERQHTCQKTIIPQQLAQLILLAMRSMTKLFQFSNEKRWKRKWCSLQVSHILWIIWECMHHNLYHDGRVVTIFEWLFDAAWDSHASISHLRDARPKI